MRTTLTIDNDLIAKIDNLRRREGLSFKGAVNELLRAGVQYRAKPPKPTHYRTQPRRLGLHTGFDPAKLNQLADELEADTFTSTVKK